VIAHVDADSFFASVLLRLYPHLRGKPLLAVGMGGNCVIAATYEAKAKGVKTGMRLSEARVLVPGAIEMPSDFRETGIASEQIEAILKDVFPIIEQMSIDEWFLDLRSMIGGVPKDPRAWGLETQKNVLQMTDLSVSIGIAPSKLLAKMAGEYRKPAGVTFLKESDIKAFLKDRPAAAIPGIGTLRC
jgi:nucleotidyltransferase/DNA polymerase involved in DNA repair